ncbi:MAG: trypsin-like peptidase domain-containing protein [Acidobacteria bacterium]|nr:trypsin-like peptidase domain-containing protein [Acidobacteriota bacterium]
MERMLIKHLSGSKANQVEEFALKHHNELIFGRDAGATVKYDPDRDDTVGRQHAKVTRDPNEADGFLVADMNSRNGTFLNKQRINGTVKINPGDTVQLGTGGPEFQFEVEPRPANATKATRVVESSAFGKSSPETRVVSTNSGGGDMSSSIPTLPMGATKPIGTVGKATVERMISQTVSDTKKSQGRQYGIIGGAAAVAVLLLFGIVVGGAYYYNSKQQQAREQNEQQMKMQLASQQQESASRQAELEKTIAEDKSNAPKAASEIADKYGKAVVEISVAWRLLDKQKSAQLYHQYIPNSREVLAKFFKRDFGKGQIVPNAGSEIPLYVPVGDSIEPLLTTEKTEHPIGGSHMGSGFIVSEDGYILTNRHVAATWATQYQFSQNTPPGLVLGNDGPVMGPKDEKGQDTFVAVKSPRDWVPANTKQDGRQYQGAFIGQNDELEVALPGKENRLKGTLEQVSPRADVAMIKVGVPGGLTKVELFDNYDTLKKGESLVIMGYPGTTASIYGVIKSQDQFSKDTEIREIYDPTVTVTAVGNILRSSDPNDQKNIRISQTGDQIMYPSGLTFGGNSGGPVFDMQGRVIGIHNAGNGINAGYAVPIRYGKELYEVGQ